MNLITKVATATAVALALVAAPTAAFAEDSPAPTTTAPEATITLHWLTTNTTEPTGSTVNWPQSYYPEETCGTGWIQDDVVLNGTEAHKATVAALIAAGQLNQGDDASVIVSWSFHQQTPCPPEQPAPLTRQNVVVGEPVCATNEDGTFPGGGTIATTVTNYETAFVFDADANSWVPGEEKQVGEPVVTTTSATLEVCPATVITPPVPPVTPPTVTPTVPPPTVDTTKTVKALAYTGESPQANNARTATVVFGALALLLGLGALISVTAYRRRHGGQ